MRDPCSEREWVNWLCNEEWRLGVDEERLSQCKTLDDFQALPEVIARREERGATMFDFELGWMRFTPRALLADIVLNDAVTGVQRLVALGAISYLTARYSISDDWQNGIVAGTEQWLEVHQFASASRVIYCNKIEGKLRYLLSQVEESRERLVLVDDSYARILELIAAMNVEERELLYRNVVLVAKSCSAPPCAELQVLPLRRWRDVESVIDQLKEEHDEMLWRRRAE